MNMYLGHQKALETKRKSKSKSKLSRLLSLRLLQSRGRCPLILVELEVGDSASSSSYSQDRMLELLDQRLEASDANIDLKFKTFANSIADVIKEQMKDIMQARMSNDPVLSTAPQSVLFRSAIAQEFPTQKPQKGEDGQGVETLGGYRLSLFILPLIVIFLMFLR